MSKTIWLNLDSTKVDVTYLDDFFEKRMDSFKRAHPDWKMKKRQ